MTGKVVCLGEVMLRLSPPRLERLFQSPVLDTHFGGGEANTAVSLAQFGTDVKFVSALPANPIGEACLRFLRGFGVDVSDVQRSGERIGIYFLEPGANQRPTNVVYDRSNSAMAEVNPAEFDWDHILDGVSWFHVTGITAAISQAGADLTLAAVKAASSKGLTVSCDTSYRSKLWQYGKRPSDVMPAIAEHVNILFANLHDCSLCYGVELGEKLPNDIDEDAINMRLGKKMFGRFPSLTHQAFTHREGFSASHNAWAASIFDGSRIWRSQRYDVTHIVDRVGGGDAFAAGLIYGLNEKMAVQNALDLGAAAACLKHSVPGDVNYASVEDVEQLMAGDASGRVLR